MTSLGGEDAAGHTPFHGHVGAENGESDKFSHISKTVLSMVKFGGTFWAPTTTSWRGACQR